MLTKIWPFGLATTHVKSEKGPVVTFDRNFVHETFHLIKIVSFELIKIATLPIKYIS